jgi:hypothetical protein
MWRDYPYPLGHEIRALVPVRCRLCAEPASARSPYCDAHRERILDMKAEDSWEVDDTCL